MTSPILPMRACVLEAMQQSQALILVEAHCTLHPSTPIDTCVCEVAEAYRLLMQRVGAKAGRA